MKIIRLIGKILLGVIGVALVIVLIWVALNWSDLRAFQPVPSGAYAKFMCSSLFVEGKTEEQARNWAKVSVPVKEIGIDYTNKSVTARSLFYTSTARYVNERLGCILQ
jgi:hypothetical protein